MNFAVSAAPFVVPDQPAGKQIDLLVRHGMTVPEDELENAVLTLRHIGHIRLSEYWQPFATETDSNGNVRFPAGTTLSDVIELYIFDHKLRLLVFDAIAHVEVSVRSQWAAHLAQAAGGGPQAYMNPSLFNDQYAGALTATIGAYLRKFKKKAKSLDALSIWELAESMSMGDISRWYANIKSPGIRQAVANHYGIDEKALTTFLHHLTYIRNICAHHGRLWNLNLTVHLELPRNKPQSLAPNFDRHNRHKIYNTLAMLAYMLDVMHPYLDWRSCLLTFLDEYGSAPKGPMGFPGDWRSRPLWSAAPSFP